MKRICFDPPRAVACAGLVMALALASAFAEAAIISVPNSSYPHIQDAISAASPGDTVAVAPGTYQEAISLKDGVEVRGVETARTFLSGGGGGPIVTINSSVSATIRNFTFINALVGIQVTNNPSSLGIVNNVFQVGTSNLGKAITVASSPGTSIINNTFNGNGTAIDRDADIMIVNDIFSNNTTAIADTSGVDTNTSYNLFSGNGIDGLTGTNAVTTDPSFVHPDDADQTKRDFHLLEGSLCIDATDPVLGLLDGIDGTLADIGAYGGPNADPTPFPVQGLAIIHTDAVSIDLAWPPNNSYLVTNSSTTTGGYTISYGYAPGTYTGTDAIDGPSPIQQPAIPTAYTLNLDPTLLTPGATVITSLTPHDSALAVAWSAVAGATGYKVHYGVLSTEENKIDVHNVLSHDITGLTNGQRYQVAVSAYRPAIYYVVVTARDSTAAAHESAPSGEVSTQIGPLLESGPSGILSDSPDALSPYPTLPNTGGGCFIATAAYGSYAAPEVQVLRNFRDRFLLTTGTGRRLVAWYYRNSPAAAELLNAHPSFKPAVRVMLLPAVAMAGFLTDASGMVLAGVLLLLGSTTVFMLVRKGSIGRRGVR